MRKNVSTKILRQGGWVMHACVAMVLGFVPADTRVTGWTIVMRRICLRYSPARHYGIAVDPLRPSRCGAERAYFTGSPA